MERKVNRSWLGAIFGLVFLFAGLAAAYGSAGKMIVDYMSSSGWIEVPAIIHDVSLVAHRGDSTTYSVKSSYSYKLNGVTYTSNRVSLSSGSDSIGSYWEDLSESLAKRQYSNEASAIVNPVDPTQSILDRTLRWESIVFGSVFLIIFGGIGGGIAWASLRGTKSRKTRIQHELLNGIDSDQKTGSWFLAAFGGVFFVMGTGISLLALPDAIRDKEYGALFVLVFVFIGVAIIYQAYKIRRAYRRFGPSPLHLDPAVPGVGGELGGRFSINVPGIGYNTGSAPTLQASLTCTRKTKSGKNTRRNIIWQEEAPVYLKQTANGVDGTFLFTIPDSCKPSAQWSSRSSINWSVSVLGQFSDSNRGKFERSWGIEVEEHAAQASHSLSIPQSFILNAREDSNEQAAVSALEQVPVTEDTKFISVQSKAGRYAGSKILMISIGAVFSTVGVISAMQSWWPGYVFVTVGCTMALIALYSLGKSIDVKIERSSGILFTQESWFGFVYAKRQADIYGADQFSVKHTSSTTANNRMTEYYAVEFKSDNKKIRIADGIAGKREALALRDAIVTRYFNDEQLAVAA